MEVATSVPQGFVHVYAKTSPHTIGRPCIMGNSRLKTWGKHWKDTVARRHHCIILCPSSIGAILCLMLPAWMWMAGSSCVTTTSDTTTELSEKIIYVQQKSYNGRSIAVHCRGLHLGNLGVESNVILLYGFHRNCMMGMAS